MSAPLPKAACRGDTVAVVVVKPLRVGSANRWKPEESDRLYALFCEGVSYADIAAETGRTVDAVKGKLRAWGLSRGRGRDAHGRFVARPI